MMKNIMKIWNSYLFEANESNNNIVKAIMYNEDDETCLLLKRIENNKSDRIPWEWDLPGGHIEKSETKEEALKREIKEETNLLISTENCRILETQKRITFFVITKWSGNLQISHEHEDYEWVYKEDVNKYDLGPQFTNVAYSVFNK